MAERILETLGSPAPEQVSTNSPKPSYRNRMLNADDKFKRTWLKSRLGLTHHHCDLSRLEEEIFRFCQGFARSPWRGRRLVIYGNNGNGKSRTARAVQKWVDDRAVDLPLVNADEGMRLCNSVLVNWAEQVDRFKQGLWEIGDLLDASLLIIDDIGAEHDPTKVGVEKLYLILERRANKWTLVTTNLFPKQWENQFDRRIADRLFRHADHVDLTRVPSYSIHT